MPNQDRWSEIEAVFHGARMLQPGERTSYIADHCAADFDLQTEVEALLAADGETDELDQPLAVAHLFQSRIEPGAGQVIGVYRVLRKIGSGGMGTVYLAERADETFHKQVALKLMSGGGSGLVKRFLKEREILANLEHPNITRLIDGGMTTDGVPYLVMEFVDGVVLSEYAASLGLIEKAKLCAAICDAVHYAHQHLIIHRDLKPANVMVTHDGVPKLLDFGVAKLLADSDSRETVTHAMMMTPRYASPEQLHGESVSTLSDIYSLGVILDELLDGAAPRDLLKIAAKARQSLPAARYAAAAEMGDDLRHYLAGEPVLAHEATVRYRIAKFVQRHRLGVIVAAFAALAIVGGTGISLWQAKVAQTERSKAEALSGFVIDLLAKADPGRARKDLKVSEVLDQAVAHFDQGWHGDADTEIAMRTVLAQSYLGLGLSERAIAQATAAVERAARIKGPRAIETARARLQLGYSHASLFHVAAAERELREAIQLLQENRAPQEEVDGALLFLAGSLSEWGKPEESAKLAEQALAATRKTKGEEAAATGSAYCVAGRPYGVLKQAARQRDYLERGLGILRKQLELPIEFSSCLHMLAVNYSDAGELARAVQVETEAIDVYRKRVGSEHADLTPFLIARASNLRGLKRWDEAYRDADEALRIALRAWPRASEGVAYMLYHYGRIECESGKQIEGLAKLRESLAFRSRPNGSSPIQLAATRYAAASCLVLGGKLAEAAPLAQEAYRVRAGAFPPESRFVKESKALVEELAIKLR